MSYYNTRQTFFILSSTIKVEEIEKIDKFLTLLDKLGVCDLLKKQMIHDDKNKGGRPGYNVYNMLAAIIYSFAFNKDSLRNIEWFWYFSLFLLGTLLAVAVIAYSNANSVDEATAAHLFIHLWVRLVFHFLSKIIKLYL